MSHSTVSMFRDLIVWPQDESIEKCSYYYQRLKREGYET